MAKRRRGRKKPALPKVPIRPETPESQPEISMLPEERFDKAFFMTFGLIAVLFLLIFIPLIGFALVLSLTPYIAGYKGGKYVSKRNGIQVGILVGLIWAAILTVLLLEVMKMVGTATIIEPGIYTELDFLIVALIFIFNITFCAIGGWAGGRKAPTAE